MHPKVACRDIHTRIICIFRLFWRLFMQTGSSWVGWCYWSGVIYQAKFIPTSHYETLNLGKLLHILQKRLGIKRRRGGASHAGIIHQRVKNMAICVVMWFFRNKISDFAVGSFGVCHTLAQMYTYLLYVPFDSADSHNSVSCFIIWQNKSKNMFKLNSQP